MAFQDDSTFETMTCDDPAFEQELDIRISAMRSLLDLMKPESGREAFNTLRDAYPESSLEDRVSALGASKTG